MMQALFLFSVKYHALRDNATKSLKTSHIPTQKFKFKIPIYLEFQGSIEIICAVTYVIYGCGSIIIT